MNKMLDKVRKPGIGTLDKSAMDATGFDTKHINKFCGASHPDFSMSKKRDFEIDEELKPLFAPLSAEELINKMLDKITDGLWAIGSWLNRRDPIEACFVGLITGFCLCALMAFLLV